MPDAPLVWIIDSEQWPRACLRAELIERGYDAVGYLDVGEALADAVPGRPHPRLLVLELRGQALDPARLDALAGIGVPVLVLGSALDLAEPVVRDQRWTHVLRRPVSLGEVADWVEMLVPRRQTPT